MMKRRFFSILTALALSLTLLPAAARAADGQPAIRASLGSITGYSAENGYSYIYYGTWRNQPVKWRVLDTKANTGEAGALFLLTDEGLYPLGGGLFDCYTQFNPLDKAGRYLWQDSDLQSWFKNTFYIGENSAFTDAERELIPAVSKANAEYEYKSAPNRPSFYYQTGGLESEYVFAPSIEEICKAEYGFANEGSRIAEPMIAAYTGTRYWIRSYFNNAPYYVNEGGSLIGDQIADKAAVRPAMNLRTTDDTILFTSAAEGGKPAGGLKPISTDYTGSEWKLTLLDSSRSGFNVESADASTTDHGGDIKIEYSGAKTGTNEYISVMIFGFSNTPIWYGRSTDSLSTESGTATIPVAEGLDAGIYTLYVYNEQYNGEKKTDLASELKGIQLTVERAETYTITYAPGENGTGTAVLGTKIEGIDLTLAGETFTRSGYKQIGWAAIDGGEKVYDLGAVYSEDEPITLYPVWERQYDLTVKGIRVTGGNQENVLGDGKVSFVYDEATGKGTLTLTNAEIDGGADEAIVSDLDTLEIVLVGENKLSAERTGITANYDLIFSGEGSAAITATGFDGKAVECYNGITVEGGNIEATAAAEGTAFMAVGDTITVNGGTLTLKGGSEAIFGFGDPIVDLGTYGVMLTSKNYDGTGAAVTAQADVNAIRAAKYVKILAKNIPITYAPGANGTGTESQASKTYGEDFELAGALFTRVGYVQTGWAEADGGEKVYDLGGTYSGNEALTLYPVWTLCDHAASTNKPTCTETAVCTLCGGTIAALGHQPGDYQYDETDHWKVCGRDGCGAVLDKAPHEGGTATCKDKAECTVCGQPYGELAPADHTDLVKVPVKAPTIGEEGNIEYWYCSGCGRYYRDAAARIEITLKDTVIPKVIDVTLHEVVGADAANGTVSMNPRYAPSGSSVTVTGTPDAGYVLGSLTVTDSKGNELALSGSGSSFTFTMPSGKVEVRATFVEDTGASRIFYDVSGSAYYCEAVKWAVEKNITGGVGGGLFAPNRPCTRAEIVTFLWRAAGSPVVNYAMNMSDVPADAYYAEAVRWALSEGITTGTSETEFSPNAVCTRAQAVTFLCRALNAKAAGSADFSDVPADSYYASAVAWAVENGVTNGVGGGLFAPNQSCTRAEIVTFLWRAYNR